MTKIPDFAVLNSTNVANPVTFNHIDADEWELRHLTSIACRPLTRVRFLGFSKYQIRINEGQKVHDKIIYGTEEKAFEVAVGIHNYFLLWNSVSKGTSLFWHRQEADEPRQKWNLCVQDGNLGVDAPSPIEIIEERVCWTENQYTYKWALHYNPRTSNIPDLRGDAYDLITAQFDALMARQQYLEAAPEEPAQEPKEYKAPIILIGGKKWRKTQNDDEFRYTLLHDDETEIERFKLWVHNPRNREKLCTYSIEVAPTRWALSERGSSLATTVRHALNDRANRIEHEWERGFQVVSISEPQVSCDDAERYATILQEASNLPPDDTSRTREKCASYGNRGHYGADGYHEPKEPIADLDCSAPIKKLEGIDHLAAKSEMGIAPKERVMLYVDPALKQQRDALSISLAIGVALITAHMSTNKTDVWAREARELLKPVKTIHEGGFKFHVQATGNGFTIERETPAVVEIVEGSNNGHHTSMANTVSPKKTDRLCVVLAFNEIRMLYFDSSEQAEALLESLVAGHLPSLGRIVRLEFVNIEAALEN